MYRCESCGGNEPDGLGELPDYANPCVCEFNKIKLLTQKLKESEEKHLKQTTEINKRLVKIRIKWTETVEKLEGYKAEIDKLKGKLNRCIEQNYCTMCGNTLDGYKPPQKKEMESYIGIQTKSGEKVYLGCIVYVAGIGNLKVVWDECLLQYLFQTKENENLDYQDIIEDLEHVVSYPS